MNAVALRPLSLDRWLAERLGMPLEAVTREHISQYQLGAVQDALRHARAHSRFYSQTLASVPPGFPRTLADMQYLPLTTEQDLVRYAHDFLSVSQSRIARVVTMESSGTVGAPKRLFFTEGDLSLSLEFFAHGVLSLLSPGQRMLIALPVERDGSVGQLLARGIAHAGVEPILHGVPTDLDALLQNCHALQPACIIGFPVHMLAMARHPLASYALQSLRTIVLCSDFVSPSLRSTLQSLTGAEIFEHYGSTEMGLGGGIDCHAHAGYHLRDVDLYFEVVSPQTGEVLPDGEVGELVFTTLHREAMPLIRYRTGDLSRFVPEPCSCGSQLRRLERIHNRVNGFVVIGNGATLTLPMLDNALFRLPAIRNFRVRLVRGTPERIEVALDAPGIDPETSSQAEHALSTLPCIADSCATGALELRLSTARDPFPVSPVKRRIEVCCEH